MYLNEQCKLCGGWLDLGSTTNEWNRVCRTCDKRFNEQGEEMPDPWAVETAWGEVRVKPMTDEEQKRWQDVVGTIVPFDAGLPEGIGGWDVAKGPDSTVVTLNLKPVASSMRRRFGGRLLEFLASAGDSPYLAQYAIWFPVRDRRVARRIARRLNKRFTWRDGEAVFR